MDKYTKAVLTVFLSVAVAGCASPEYRQMKKAQQISKAKMSEVAKKYDYECRIEAAQLFPTAIATYDKEVFEMGQFKSGGTGTYDATCSKGYGFGDITCKARERQGMTYERGRTKTVTKSYDKNSDQRDLHKKKCLVNRILNNPDDMEKLKPYQEALKKARQAYERSK